MQHEPLLELAFERFDQLLVLGCAEGAGDDRLGLAAGEQRRAMGARQRADLAGHVANLVERAAVEALLAVEDRLAGDLLDHALEDRLDPRLLDRGFVLRQGVDRLLADGVDGVLLLELALGVHRRA